MRTRKHAAACVCVLALMGSVAGCASRETAVVNFSYVVEPTSGMPLNMHTLIIVPAKLGPTTDPHWSDMSTTIMKSLVNESRSYYGTNVDISDRRDTQVVFDEADLAAAGMSTRRGGQPARLYHAEGAILSKIDVKVEKHIGRKRTLSGISFQGGGGRYYRHGGWGHGGGSVQTREVETVSRNITVQTSFKLLDTSNNRVIEYYAPKTFRATDKTKASAIFGSSQTEAELTPRDRIIATLVERGAREFISRLMPCRMDIEAVVESSRNRACSRGVRLLRGEDYEGAVYQFDKALVSNPDDHRAAYAAGIACEASGRYEDALDYYRQACIGADLQIYRDARDRMKAHADRIRS